MSRKGENIYKRKDGRWEGRYIMSRSLEVGTRYGYVYDPTYSGVKSKLRYTQAYSQAEVNLITFKLLAEKWLLSCKSTVKQSTYAQYYNRLNKHILPYFGEMYCSHITQKELTEFVDSRAFAATPLSPKTMKDMLSIIKLVLSQSEMPHLLDFNGIKIKDTSSNIRVLSMSEQKCLEKELLSKMTLKKMGVMLSLYTGIRVGELCALTSKDVDLQRGVLHINKTIQRMTNIGGDTKTKLVVDTPKSHKSIRDIPLPSFIIELVTPFYNDAQTANFLTSSDKYVVEPRSMQRFFENLAKKLGLLNVSIHTLRHTFATRYIECGLDVKSLSELLGHSSVNITLNRYVHPSFDMKKSNMEKLKLLM